MAYNKEKVFKDVIKVIQENKLKHFDYIEAFVEPCKKTLYELFPMESDESHTIKRELELNKINSKTKMINKWEDSDNPTLQIAAFKLIATEEEKQSLSTNWQKNEHSGEIKTKQQTDLSKLSEKTLRQVEKELKKNDKS